MHESLVFQESQVDLGDQGSELSFSQTQPRAAAAEQMSSQVCRLPAPHGHPGSHGCVPGVPQHLHP